MRLTTIFGVLGAVQVVAALPDLQERAYCVRDKCQNAMAAGPRNVNAKSASSAARKDCSSFLGVTVTPCPVTSTKTITSVKTAAPVTKSVSTTDRTTVTRMTVVTIPTTTTTTPTTTQTILESSFSTSTVVISESATTIFSTDIQTEVSTQLTTVFQPAKRALATTIPARYPESTTDGIEARNYPVQPRCPSAQIASKLPTYASCCSKAPAYSSACSCLGITRGATTTLPAPITTITKTVCKTVTPTRTQTTTIKQSVTSVETVISSTLIISTGEDETVTETSTLPIDVTVTSTTTDVSSAILTSTTTTTTSDTVPTSCPFFQLQAVGGATDGQYIRSQGESNKLAFTASRESAAVFEIDSSGKLITGGLIANTDNRALYYVYLETQATITTAGYLPLICQKTPSLMCATSNGQTRFAVCPSIGPGDPGPGPALLFGTTSTADCSYISLTTLPAPQCP